MEGSISVNRGLWNVSLFLFIAGLAALGAGAVCQFLEQIREPDTEWGTARVVDLVLKENGEKSSLYPYKNCYYPVLEYYAQGKLYKVLHTEGAYPSAYHLNQELRICYNRNDPEQYELADISRMRAASIGCSVLGVAGLCVACIVFLLFAVRYYIRL